VIKKKTLRAKLDKPYPQNFWVMGVDEVGAGCLAGPLVTAAYAYNLNDAWVEEELAYRVFDSKALNEKEKIQSETALKKIDSAFYQIHYVPVKEIDTLNIYHARMKGLFDVAVKLKESMKHEFMGQDLKIFIDGPVIPKYFNDTSLDVEAISKGDSKLFPIAAASILAKMERDRFMADLDKKYPGYSWSTNVGYPTAKHKEAIREHGLTEWHRLSFKLI
jgi:ribonuclease HII